METQKDRQDNGKKFQIFISHSSDDFEYAKVIRKNLVALFGQDVIVFASSDEECIGLGDKWLDKVNSNLRNCDLMLVVCTPESVKRPWVAFETGIGWGKNILVIPLCCRGLNLNQLAQPYSQFQGVNLEHLHSVERLVRQLRRNAHLIVNEGIANDQTKTFVDELKKLNQHT